MLSLDVALEQGDFTLACVFESRERVTGIFGPSGAGKSTLLRVIAGLARPDSGRIELAGRCVFDAARGIDVPAHRRRIGFVFQQARLFPHLNVKKNLAYGGWFAPARPRRARVDQVVEMLDIGALLARRVAGLSGGEAQRVAIGRALLSDPALLLLDEPLASLDAPRKQEVLPYIERLSRESELPIVFVSHQLDEMLRLANRHVVALRAGGVVFSGPTAVFLARPDLIGAEHAAAAGSLIAARVARHLPDDDLSVLVAAGQELFVPRLEQPPDTPVTLHIRARDVIIARHRPTEISALNVWAARITSIVDQGNQGIEIVLDAGGQRLEARITRRSATALALQENETVYAVIKSLALAEQAWERLGGL